MKTEQEAHACWCPFVGIAAGARPPQLGSYDCIASECMAWRWAYRFMHVETGEGTHFEPKRGYCGLAGQP